MKLPVTRLKDTLGVLQIILINAGRVTELNIDQNIYNTFKDQI